MSRRRSRVCLILDALGDRLQPEGAGEIQGGRENAPIGLAGAEVGHEAPVDLEVVERERLQRADAGEAGAEVVEGEPAPALAQRVREPAGRVHVLDHLRLRDLGERPCGTARRRFARAPRSISSIRPTSPIDVPDRLTCTLIPPAADSGAAGDHPAIDVADHPGLLGRGQELPRRDERTVGAAHARKEPALDHLAGRHLDDRLAMQLEAVLGEAPRGSPAPRRPAQASARISSSRARRSVMSTVWENRTSTLPSGPITRDEVIEAHTTRHTSGRRYRASVTSCSSPPSK